MSTLPPSAFERIQETIRKTPSPTRAQGRARRRRLLLVAVGVLAATALMHGIGVFAAKPWGYTVASTLSVGLLAVLLSGLLRRYLESPLGPRREMLLRANQVVLPGLLLGSAAGNLAAPATIGWPSERAMCHLPCTILLLMSGGVLAAVGVLALRRADPLTPKTTAATVGAVAGAWASLAVSLQCALTDPLHVLGTHVLPVVLLMVATAHWGSRVVGLNLDRPV